MKIHRLVAENFMKLNVDVEINGHDVTITGKNETGKTTFIDSIWFALTGKGIPEEPIQQGKESAMLQVEVKRQDGVILIATRKFKREGKDTLSVKTMEGATFSSPQTFLNTLIGEISFDPTEFSSLQPAVQKARLQKILGIDLTELENNKRIKLAEKNHADEQITKLTAELDALPENTATIVERFMTEVDDKLKAIKDAKKSQDDLNEIIRTVEKDQNDIIVRSANRSQNMKYNTEKIVQLNAQIKALTDLNTKIMAEDALDDEQMTVKTNHIADLKKELNLIEVPKDDEIQITIKEITENNILFKAQQDRLEKVKQLDVVSAVKTAKVSEIESLEAERVKKIAAVKMPIAGLDFSEEGLTFDSLPFAANQFSTAKMDEIGFAISIALNPGLKILRMKDWALFDTERKERVLKMAADNGFQTFMEQVTDDASIGFIISE